MKLNRYLGKLVGRTICSALVLLMLLSAPLQVQALQLDHAVSKYTSCIDGQDDYYVYLPGKNDTLILYLHSLSGDFNEPFAVKSQNNLASVLIKEFPDSGFLSINYGRVPSWGDAAARLDITRLLSEIIKKSRIRNILILGVSMGASTALVYTATAPDYIKSKIVGVVVVSPCANLEDLYKKTAAPEIKTSLEKQFGLVKDKMPIGFEQNSFDTCVVYFPTKSKVAIISATEDKAVPIELQKIVLRDLNNRDVRTKYFETEGQFESLPIKNILEAGHFILE